MRATTTERLRVGIAGAGLIAQRAHLPQLADMDDRFAVCALAEPQEQLRDAVARRYAIPHTHAAPGALLAEEALDAVIVCSPNDTHAELVIAALEAGVHVLVEKPLCLTVPDADRVIAARDRAGVVVQVGYMKRFDPAYETLIAELDDEPPELVHVAGATYDPGLAAAFGQPSAPRAADVHSDVILGALVHDVNLVHGMLERLGVPVPGRVVDGFARPDGAAAGATIVLGDGVRWSQAWLRIDGLGDFRERVTLYGTADVRELEFPAPYLRSAASYRRSAPGQGGNVTRTFRSWRESYRRQLEHFHSCIVDGTACRTPPEQARTDLECLTAVDAAAGRAVRP